MTKLRRKRRVQESIHESQFCRERKKKLTQFWKDHDIFKKSIETEEKVTLFTLSMIGPPTANGKPHIGHVLTRVIKDMIPRIPYNEGLHGST